MDTLKELMESQGMTSRVFAERAGISFRAITEIRSGQWDTTVRSTQTLRKRRAAVQVMTRVVSACGQDPKEWAKKFNFSLTPAEIASAVATALVGQQTVYKTGNVSIDWNILSTILVEPLTPEDLEKLSGGQKALGEFFTLELAVRLLFSTHKRS